MILIDQKSHKNILICKTSCMKTKPLRIRFNKIDGLIKVQCGIRYLVLSSPDKYDAIYNSIKIRRTY